jgi:hypothetical protein
MEVSSIIILMFITINLLDLVGVIAAAISLLTGRLLANAYLFAPFSGVLKTRIADREDYSWKPQ